MGTGILASAAISTSLINAPDIIALLIGIVIGMIIAKR